MKKIKMGLINFCEDDMPWTRVKGKYELINQTDGSEFGIDEVHWTIRLENGETTSVPESSVVVIE